MFRTLLILLFMGATPVHSAGFSGPAFDGHALGSVERVIDGDTIKMRVAIWLDQEITVAVRVAGIDAPELFRPRCDAERTLALEAKVFAEDFLKNGEAELTDIEQGKYAGRVVANINAAGGDLGAALVSAGLASSGGKGNWC
ncbi:thermonuclease family protein [Hyphococcus flavus]|uniref:Thermonuclease family protein n=1 Tax=Hyphococcus flavus TaxID=1866326 RepID=A0AAE9ZLU9_9PROT|nr:thermonuclease family protein [Hyphococcus flavus]WDI33135.1 thermonuclease family protein [Hyphococcus flavus]